MVVKYKARIYCETEVDSYEHGLTGEFGTSWDRVIVANTFNQLIEEVADYVNAKPSDLMFDDINEYEHSSEAWFDYLADEHNYEAGLVKIERWRQGELKLWNVHCHILISEVIERKFDILKKMDSYHLSKSFEHTAKAS
jgi:hypothetical protein